MAGMYPSLEDMKVDHILQAQGEALGQQVQQVQQVQRAQQVQQQQVAYPSATSAEGQNLPYPLHPSAPGHSSMYPELGTFMGLEFNEEVIRQNMPEYLPALLEQGAVVSSNTQLSSSSGGGLVAPISGQSVGYQRSQINHGVRQVILCKDANGKVGLRVKSIDKGVFVALVTKGSPAALGSLRFGDQILQINGENVAGYSEPQVHKIFKKANVNNIVLAVRDRPFERTLTLHKDSTGHIGFQFNQGEIKAIVVDSSAARNGLLISHHLVEVNGQNVVGISDKEIGEIIDSAGNIVTVTVIPSFVHKHMMKNISQSLVKKMMDHSIIDM